MCGEHHSYSLAFPLPILRRIGFFVGIEGAQPSSAPAGEEISGGSFLRLAIAVKPSGEFEEGAE